MMKQSKTTFGKYTLVCLAVILLLAAVMLVMAGCRGELAVEFEVEGLHQGQPMPELKITSNHKGTVRWEDENGVLINGTNMYRYIYKDNFSGEETVFEVNLTASEHQSSEESQVIKSPSCVEEGVKAHICQICQQPYDKESIPMTEHDYSLPVHTEGDCLKVGYTHYKCHTCNQYRLDENGEKYVVYDTTTGSHVFEKNADGSEKVSTVVEASTCAKEGSGLVKCSLCGFQKQVSIDKIPHDFKTEKHTDGNCVTYGYTEYFCIYNCGAQQMEQDGQTPYKKYDTEYGAHDYSVAVHTLGNCVKHGYYEYKCSICGGFRYEADGKTTYKESDNTYGTHTFEINPDGSEKVSIFINAPTCAKDGNGLVKCTACDYQKEVTIDKVDHDYTKEKHTEGNCKTYGYTEYFCIYNCGKQLLEQDGRTPYRKLDTQYGPHDYSVAVHTAGNCITHGYHEYKCSICDAFRYLDDGKTTYKESDNKYGAHTFEKNPDGSEKVSTVTSPATCEKTGSGLVKCTVCDYQKEVTIDKVPHDFTLEKHTEGDCKTYGYTEYFCIFNCGKQQMLDDGKTPYKKYDTEYGPHDFSKTKYTAGNCMVKGYTETLCSICGDFKMAADGSETYKQYDKDFGEHKYETDENGNYIVTKDEIVSPATCKATGSGYVYCVHDTTPDHSHKKLVSIPMTEHKYDKNVLRFGPDEPQFHDCQHEMYNESHCIYECGSILKNPDGSVVKQMLGEFGPHKFVNGICSLCGKLDEIQKMWNFGPANAPGFTTDENGYSDAVVVYLVLHKDNENNGSIYYDMIVKAADGYVGPTYMAQAQAYIPWFQSFEEGGLVNTNTYATRVKTVTVCEGVTALSDYMFMGMTALEKTILPDSLEIGAPSTQSTALGSAGSNEVRFGKYLFYNCKSLNILVNVPENLQFIGTFAFWKCQSLPEFPFGTEMVIVEREAFRYCTSLTAVDLSKCSKLKEIGYNCFEFCPINSYIVLPNDTINFGSGAGLAFGGSYQNIIFVMGDGVNSTIPHFAGAEVIYIGEGVNINDVLKQDAASGIYYIDAKKTPVYISAFTDSKIGAEVFRLPYDYENFHEYTVSTDKPAYTDFKYNDGIILVYSAVNIKTQELKDFFESYENIVRIGSYAFINSSGLESIQLPDSVVDIGAFAFDNCENLTEFTVSEASMLESIGANAFANTKIASIRLPKNLNVLGVNALKGMSELSEVIYDCGNFNMVRDGLNAVTPYVFPDYSILYYTNTTKDVTVVIGKNATVVNTCAFRGASKVNKVDFTNATSLRTIETAAFQNTAVKTLDISTAELLVNVRDYAFSGCSALEYAKLNIAIEAWGTDAFGGKEILEITGQYTDPETGAVYDKVNGNNFWRLVSVPAGLTDFVMNDGTKMIVDGAFNASKDTLESVTIGNSVTVIPAQLFNGFSSLNAVKIPASVTSFGTQAFYQTAITKVYYAGSVSDWCNITFADANPSSTPLYGGNADLYFDGQTETPVTELVIPASVTEIKSCAFTYAKITKLSFEDGSLCTKIGSYAFADCAYLTEITVPENIAQIGEKAFINAKALTKITFNAINCADIAEPGQFSDGYVFNYAGTQGTGIELIIGENVETIPANLFRYDDGVYSKPNITSLKLLGNKVTRIGNRAFCNPTGITKAYIKDMDAWLKINFDFGDVEWRLAMIERPSGTNFTTHAKENSNPLRYVTDLRVWDETAGDYATFDTLVVTGVAKKYAIIECPAIKTVVIKSTATLDRYSIFYREGNSNVNIYSEFATMHDIYGLEDWELQYEPGKAFVLGYDWCFRSEGDPAVEVIHVHTWDSGAIIASDDKDPTCTEDGLYTFTCTDPDCLNVTKQMTIKALEHEFGELIPEDPASCTKPGLAEHYECSRCDAYAVSDGNGGYEVVEKDTLVTTVDHNYDLNNWKHDTESHWRKCKDCDATTEKVPHTAPCSECGYGSHVHEYDNGVYTDPTCTKLGYTTYTCANTDGNCTELTKVVEDAESGYAAHNFDSTIAENVSFLAGKEPSCTAVGIKEIKCSADGCSVTTTEFVLPAHTWDASNTCTCGQIKAVFTYSYNDTAKTATITAIENLGTATYIEIPNTVKHIPDGGSAEEDYKVVITANLFSKNAASATGDMGLARTQVKFIYVDAEAIPNYCFYRYSGATKLYIGKNVKTLGTNAFYYMSALTEVYYESVAMGNSTSSTKAFNYSGSSSGCTLYIDDDVTNIPDYIFQASSSSYAFKISAIEFVGTSKLESIGQYAFRYCSKLTAIEFPNGLKTIGTYAFANCSALAKVSVPASVTSIGGYAFNGIASSGEVHITDMAAWVQIAFGDSYGSPTSKLGKLFLNGELVTNVVIPEGVEVIGSGAFRGLKTIESITIPASVKSIGEYAFYDCVALTKFNIVDLAAWCKVTFGNSQANPLYYAKNLYINDVLVTDLVIPAEIERVGTMAFLGCTSIKTVTFNGVKIIGESAFEDCSALETVVFGSGVETIEFTSFYNCTALKSVTVGPNVTTIGDGVFVGCTAIETITIDPTNTRFAFTGKCLINTETYTLIAGFADSVIPTDGSVKHIGNQAFFGCTGLTSLVIPEGVESIGVQTFALCENLITIKLPDTLLSIGKQAFYGSGVADIVIPKNFTTFGENVFYGCANLIRVYNYSALDINESSDPFYQSNVQVVYKLTEGDTFYEENGYTFILYANGDITLVVYSGSDAVITLPTTVKGQNKNYKIGANVFALNTNITSVTIPDCVTELGYGLFYGCSKLEWVNIPAGITAIGKETFSNTAITAITIPSSVTAIGDFAFTGCSKLVSVTFAPGSVLDSIGQRAFYQCSALKVITIPASVKSIATYAFRDCTSLEYVYVEQGSQLGTIGTYAFYGCSTLKQVVIPASVSSIGSYAFSRCNAVTHVYYGGAAAVTNGPSKGTKYYYSEEAPVEAGNYWHYVDGVPTVWPAP